MPRKIVKKVVTSKARKTIKRKKKTNLGSGSVLRMMATMEPTQSKITQSTDASGSSTAQPPTPEESSTSSVGAKEFLQSGRTGRRNALADILDETKAAVSSSDLPTRLESLTTADTEGHKDVNEQDSQTSSSTTNKAS